MKSCASDLWNFLPPCTHIDKRLFICPSYCVSNRLTCRLRTWVVKCAKSTKRTRLPFSTITKAALSSHVPFAPVWRPGKTSKIIIGSTQDVISANRFVPRLTHLCCCSFLLLLMLLLLFSNLLDGRHDIIIAKSPQCPREQIDESTKWFNQTNYSSIPKISPSRN